MVGVEMQNPLYAKKKKKSKRKARGGAGSGSGYTSGSDDGGAMYDLGEAVKTKTGSALRAVEGGGDELYDLGSAGGGGAASEARAQPKRRSTAASDAEHDAAVPGDLLRDAEAAEAVAPDEVYDLGGVGTVERSRTGRKNHGVLVMPTEVSLV